MKRTTIIIAVLCVLIVSVVPRVYAADRFESMLNKLGRGMTNIVTGLLELPFAIDTEIDETGVYKGIPFGILKGLVRSIVRMSAGVYEVISFPIEVPEDYVPVFDPEFVFVTE
jgi:putative exosortase-associated protein (TIGR04073 family)